MNRKTEVLWRPKASGFIIAFFTFIIWTLGGGLPLSASVEDQGAGQPVSPLNGHNVPADGHKRAAARVNGVEIPMDSVRAVMLRINTKKIRGGATADPVEVVKKEALHGLIIQELAYQKAKKSGIKADEKAVAAELENFRKRIGGEEKFREFLNKTGRTEEDLRVSAEKKIVIDAIAAKEVTARISVPEEDLKKVYESEKKAFGTPEKILITNVVFFFRADDKEDLKKAEAVLDAIRADKNTNPWSVKSDDTFVVRDLEVLQDEEPELYAAAKKMKKGELSGVLKTSDSLQIIKLLQYQPLVEVSFEQARASIQKKLMEEAKQKRMREWEAELEKDATIEILDTGSE